MSFSRLLATNGGQIILANLYWTLKEGLIRSTTMQMGLKSIYTELAMLPPLPSERELARAFRTALFGIPARFQVQGLERPRRSAVITAVVAFDTVSEILEKILQRTGRYRARIDAIQAPNAPDNTVAKAADLINFSAPSLPDITLSTWGTLFWGAKSEETDRIIGAAPSTTNIGSPLSATRLRDALGLVHIDPAPSDPARHIFSFRAKRSLAKIANDFGTALAAARPSTFDGWDNPRFCQPVFLRSTAKGYGHTIDLAGGGFAGGISELVCTPLPIMHFECRYIGALNPSNFGGDTDYLAVLLRSDDPSIMAAELDAATP